MTNGVSGQTPGNSYIAFQNWVDKAGIAKEAWYSKMSEYHKAYSAFWDSYRNYSGEVDRERVFEEGTNTELDELYEAMEAAQMEVQAARSEFESIQFFNMTPDEVVSGLLEDSGVDSEGKYLVMGPGIIASYNSDQNFDPETGKAIVDRAELADMLADTYDVKMEDTTYVPTTNADGITYGRYEGGRFKDTSSVINYITYEDPTGDYQTDLIQGAYDTIHAANRDDNASELTADEYIRQELITLGYSEDMVEPLINSVKNMSDEDLARVLDTYENGTSDDISKLNIDYNAAKFMTIFRYIDKDSSNSVNMSEMAKYIEELDYVSDGKKDFKISQNAKDLFYIQNISSKSQNAVELSDWIKDEAQLEYAKDLIQNPSKIQELISRYQEGENVENIETVLYAAQFLNIDKDNSGTITQKELYAYQTMNAQNSPQKDTQNPVRDYSSGGHDRDGLVSGAKQNAGDCWIHAAVNSLPESLMHEIIEFKDENTSIIHLLGVGDITITEEDVQKALDRGGYAQGDNDMIRIELAIERAVDMIKDGTLAKSNDSPDTGQILGESDNILNDGGLSATAYLMLTGRLSRSSYGESNITKALDNFKNSNGTLAMTAETDIETKIKDINGEELEIMAPHAYTVHKVNSDGTIEISESNTPNETRTISQEAFLEAFYNVETLDLTEPQSRYYSAQYTQNGDYRTYSFGDNEYDPKKDITYKQLSDGSWVRYSVDYSIGLGAEDNRDTIISNFSNRIEETKFDDYQENFVEGSFKNPDVNHKTATQILNENSTDGTKYEVANINFGYFENYFGGIDFISEGYTLIHKDGESPYYARRNPDTGEADYIKAIDKINPDGTIEHMLVHTNMKQGDTEATTYLMPAHKK